MAYVIVYKEWLPYALMQDRRGFVSNRFGNGHSGVDSVGNQYGNPVCAVVDGVVESVTNSDSMGRCVEYGNQNVRIACYHLASVVVKEGDRVEAGKTRIGIEGSSGTLAKGKHLHSSMWIDGVLVDPELYLAGKKEFPVEEKNAKYGVRKVTRTDLNLRKGPGVGNESYGMIPLGRILNVQETEEVGGAVWGRVTVKMADGKVYTGYSNLGDTWSAGYRGAVKEDDGNGD